MQVLIVDDDMATVDVIQNSVKWKELGVTDTFAAYITYNRQRRY